MISSSGEQNDKEVLETSFARLMQMCVIEERGIAEVKISLPTPSLAHLSFFPSSVQLLCGRARKVWDWQLTRGPFGQSQSKWLQLVGMFTNQNQINILIYKLIHIFHAYFIHIKGNTVPAPGGSLPRTNNVLCPHKTDFQMPLWRKWRGVWIILRLGKQIKHISPAHRFPAFNSMSDPLLASLLH